MITRVRLAVRINWFFFLSNITYILVTDNIIVLYILRSIHGQKRKEEKKHHVFCRFRKIIFKITRSDGCNSEEFLYSTTVVRCLFRDLSRLFFAFV